MRRVRKGVAHEIPTLRSNHLGQLTGWPQRREAFKILDVHLHKNASEYTGQMVGCSRELHSYMMPSRDEKKERDVRYESLAQKGWLSKSKVVFARLSSFQGKTTSE